MKEPTLAASEVHQDSTEPMKSFKNEANVLFVEKTIKENVFFLFCKKVIKRTYSPSYYFNRDIESLPILCLAVIFLTFTYRHGNTI